MTAQNKQEAADSRQTIAQRMAKVNCRPGGRRQTAAGGRKRTETECCVIFKSGVACYAKDIEQFGMLRNGATHYDRCYAREVPWKTCFEECTQRTISGQIWSKWCKLTGFLMRTFWWNRNEFSAGRKLFIRLYFVEAFRRFPLYEWDMNVLRTRGFRTLGKLVKEDAGGRMMPWSTILFDENFSWPSCAYWVSVIAKLNHHKPARRRLTLMK
jgi:hypothetical protein